MGRRRRLLTLAAMAALVAACASPNGNLWPSYAVAPSAAAAPAAAATPSSTVVPSAAVLAATPAPSPDSPPTTASTPTPTRTAAPKRTLAPAPTSRASRCTGTASDRQVFADAAAALSFPVYCGVLPSGWSVQAITYNFANGGEVHVYYQGPGGGSLKLDEGAYCTAYSGCVTKGTLLGPASFGGIATELYDVTISSPAYAIWVSPYDFPSYAFLGSGVTSAAFKSFAAAMYRVPRA